jgi:surfeit locus 1 family protein
MPRKFLTPRWIITTLLALAGVAVLIRLGIWQLDRLEWRREFNTRVVAQINAPALDLNSEQPAAETLYEMEYRQVQVRGVYDFSQEVLLRNQVWDNQLGYRVLTPLHVSGSNAWILVDRGWIPYDSAQPEQRTQYQEPGEVLVRGVLRRTEEKPDFGGVPDPTLSPGETRLDAWNLVNVARIQAQVNQPLLLAWVQQAPDATWTGLPYRSQPEIEITEGSHLSYAIQWFTFAAILAIGYPFFVRRQLRGDGHKKTTDHTGNMPVSQPH